MDFPKTLLGRSWGGTALTAHASSRGVIGVGLAEEGRLALETVEVRFTRAPASANCFSILRYKIGRSSSSSSSLLLSSLETSDAKVYEP